MSIVRTSDELDAATPKLRPGDHLIFIGELSGAILSRCHGLVLRDTCVILTHDTGTHLAYLIRKPLEGTVVTNLLSLGTGVLNIPACRVTLDASPWSVAAVKGRWPSNVLAVHTPQCRQVGTRQVSSGKTPEVLGERVSGLYNVGTERRLASTWMSKSYGDDDGMETLIRWECDDACPVKYMDAGDGNSRYHSQFETLDGALSWLQTLITPC